MTNLPSTTKCDARDDDNVIVVPPEDRVIMVPPRRPQDFAIPLSDGRRWWICPPLAQEEVPGLLEVLLREWVTDGLTTAARACLSDNIRRRRRPSIGRMIAAAERSGKKVTSITMPDGVTLRFGESESTEASNPWLAGIDDKAAK